MKFQGLGVGCALLLAGGTAAADEPHRATVRGFYAGLDVGRSRLEAQHSVLFFGPDADRRSASDTGLRLRAGYQFSRYFALEAGYADFGELDLSGVPYSCPVGAPAPCTYNLKSKTRGPLMKAVVTWPFADRWNLDARFGGLYAEVSTSEVDPDIAGSRRHYSDSSLGFSYGVGLRYEISPQWNLSVDWQQFDQVDLGLGFRGGASFYDLGSSALTSLGVTYRF